MRTLNFVLLSFFLTILVAPASRADESAPEPEVAAAAPAQEESADNQIDTSLDARLQRALAAVPSSGAELLHKAEVGIASFYGAAFKGRKTASGERFDPMAATVAHRSLPLGTEVKITNLENGRTVNAVINDRGPFVHGRIVDVSYMLAHQLDFVRSGMTRVKIEVQNWGPIKQLRSRLGRDRKP